VNKWSLQDLYSVTFCKILSRVGKKGNWVFPFEIRRYERLKERKVVRKVLAIGMVLLMVAVVFAALPMNVGAGSSEKGVTTRPIEDFVDAQGTYNGLFLSWVDNAFTMDSSFDYAGLDNEATDKDLGTTFFGTITEKPLADGTTLVHVNLHTKNALARAYDIALGDYVFGSTVAEVNDGDNPSLGNCRLDLTYITTAEPGADMPDLWEMIFEGIPGTYPTKVNFVATSKGELNSEFGVEQGTPGMVKVVIEANFNAPGVFNNNHGWPASTVDVKQIGN
jgi:hypothetical protein